MYGSASKIAQSTIVGTLLAHFQRSIHTNGSSQGKKHQKNQNPLAFTNINRRRQQSSPLQDQIRKTSPLFATCIAASALPPSHPHFNNSEITSSAAVSVND